MPVNIKAAHHVHDDAVVTALTLLFVSTAIPFLLLCAVAAATHGGQLTRYGLLTTIEISVPDEVP